MRVIAATNRDLSKLVHGDRFRLDLFYRLNVFSITLPPLRERADDIPRLAEHFLRQLGPMLSKDVMQIAPDALERFQVAVAGLARVPPRSLATSTTDNRYTADGTALALLMAHPWPGNVRELQNALKFALVQTTGSILTADCLPQSLRSMSDETSPTNFTSDPNAFDLVRYIRSLLGNGETDLYRRVQTEMDRVLLREVLAHVHDNQVQASELLGISRTTLRSKLTQLELHAVPIQGQVADFTSATRESSAR